MLRKADGTADLGANFVWVCQVTPFTLHTLIQSNSLIVVQIDR